MPRFALEIGHQLDPAEVRARLDRALPELRADYGADCHWDGERLLVTRKGLQASVEIRADRLQIQLELGLLLAPLAGGIRSGIERKLTALLA